MHNVLTPILLLIDGDGVGVLSELTILRELMYRIQVKLDLPTIPRPCDWFQLIGGSGTGGLVAILLGRLRLPVEEATRCYLDIMGRVFDKKRTKPHDRAAELERVLKPLVENHCNDPDAPMVETSCEAPACKVIVYAMAAASLQASTPVCIRSYRVAENQGPECTIIEAIRMTAATPDAIAGQVIYDGGIETSYIGAVIGCNNPTAQLLVEVGRAYPDRPTACIVSTGAGQHRHIGIQKPKGLLDSLSTQIKAAANAIAKDCERIHEEVAVRFSNAEDLYFRFNPDQGNQSLDPHDTSRLSDIQACAKAYLASTLVYSRLNDAAKAVVAGKEAAMLLHGNVAPILQNNQSFGRCPAPTPVFTGREDLLEKLRAYFFDISYERHLFVIYGLGGSGKTQLALMFANRYKRMFWDVFYIDASTHDTIRAGLTQIAKKSSSGDTHEDALEWLVSQEKRWLIVYNNANDPAVDLYDYFPSCTHGNILVTTRNRDMTIHSPSSESHCQVGHMQGEEATALLFKTSGVTISPESRVEANLLVEMLGFLALAIVQAGAYIRSTQCSLDSYMELFSSSRDELLRTRRVSQTDGYKLTAYATWDVSFRNPLLMHHAAQLLGVMSFMHHDEIPMHLFQTAVARVSDYQPVIPLNAQETTMKDATVEFLAALTTPKKAWNNFSWQELISNLRSFSLLDYDPVGQTYSMHPLVHSWCRGVISDPDNIRECAAWVITLCVDQKKDKSDGQFELSLIPHLVSLLDSDAVLTPTLAMDLYRVLGIGFMFRRQAPLLAHALQASKERLGAEHYQTLDCMHKLSSCFRHHFRFPEAEELLVELLSIQRRLLGDNHPTVLSLTTELGSIHRPPERQSESKALLKSTLEAQERIFGQEHPDVCKTMDKLAHLCYTLGDWDEAKVLQTRLLRIQSRKLGDEHPTLGRREDAKTLTAQVIGATKRGLGEDFVDMIPYIAMMAIAYHLDGRLAEAELLQVEALDTSKRVLGLKTQTTMMLRYNLSLTYSAQGKTREGEQSMRDASEPADQPASTPEMPPGDAEEDTDRSSEEIRVRRFFHVWLQLMHVKALSRFNNRRAGVNDALYTSISTAFLANSSTLFDSSSTPPPLDVGGILDILGVLGDEDDEDMDMDDDELDAAEADFRSFIRSHDGCPVM